MTEIEALVRRKDKLEAERREIEHWRANIRLRDRLRIAYLPRPVFGFMGQGQLIEIVPNAVEAQFYAYLGAHMDSLRKQIAEIEALLGNASQAVQDA